MDVRSEIGLHGMTDLAALFTGISVADENRKAFEGSFSAKVTRVATEGIYFVIPDYDRVWEFGPAEPFGSAAVVGDKIVVAFQDGDPDKALLVNSLSVSAGNRRTVVTVTGDTALTSFHDMVIAAGAGNYTLTLPAPGAGLALDIKRTSTANITVLRSGTALIDGSTGLTLDTPYDSVSLVCDGVNWHVLAAGGTTSGVTPTVGAYSNTYGNTY